MILTIDLGSEMTPERVVKALLTYQVCAAASSNKQLPPNFASEADKLETKWFTSMVMAAIERQVYEHQKMAGIGTAIGIDKPPKQA